MTGTIRRLLQGLRFGTRRCAACGKRRALPDGLCPYCQGVMREFIARRKTASPLSP